MPDFARWQANIVDDAGSIQPFASVEVRVTSSNALVPLFANRDGSASLGNPFLADVEGFAAFHVVGGAYTITATAPGFSRVWTYVGISTAQEHDFDPAILGETEPLVITAAGNYSVTTEKNIVFNKTVDEVTQASLPPSAARDNGILRIKDGKITAHNFPITIIPDGIETIDGQASYVIDSPGGAVKFEPRPDGLGWWTT